ncbi:SURF1 family protein [Methylomicrobium sp. Wu6]|uniref:SURF1 family protein n=1 Tax=Methylomicrobium sp. Wu6 TaxID=3107928 RepID=UPI002DD6A80F|nr:SURF1 family protein [Methylomicrobium sp. Wu6]MEC4747698.1 SURF1 family protein [Methylomicrobium sp. Wu6]
MKFEKIPTLVVLCILPILVALGFWQLDRAEQKRAFFARQQQGMAAPVVQLTALTPEDKDTLRYKSAVAIGHYDSAHQILLDNQMAGGKAGYFVLTPFILDDGNKAVLVNRGWIQANQDRKILPDITIQKNRTQITGRINHFPSVGIKLAGADRPSEGWPTVVQVADSVILSAKFGYPVFSFMIELDKQAPEGYRREWREIAVMPPEQHVAYAVQWFGLAIALALMFVWFSRVK